jgi:hypothetical protein
MAKSRPSRAKKGRAGAGARKKARVAKGGAPFVIVGVVTDKNTGLPLNNILVKIVGGTINFGKEAHTNLVGLYLMTNIFPERILIEASGGGHTPVEKSKTITGHTIINFAI